MKLNVNRENFKKALRKGSLILVAGATALSLSACTPREVSTNANVHYDMIDTSDNELLENGVQQILDVPGQDFQLVVDYKCALEDGARWTITSNKDLFMSVHTLGLDPNKRVYIDNVHTDTTIISHYPSVDGITQDTMDDRIHNSLMLGFPIADDNTYSTDNSIEGQNDTFMKESFYGFHGYSSGTVTEKRYVESDYLNAGVIGNRINSVIDLIIVDGETTTCVSIPSTIDVSVWPYTESVLNGKSSYTYYYFDKGEGKVKTRTLTADEYSREIETPKQYRKVD